MRCFAPAALKHILLKNNLDIWPQIQGKQTDVLHVEEKTLSQTRYAGIYSLRLFQKLKLS